MIAKFYRNIFFLRKLRGITIKRGNTSKLIYTLLFLPKFFENYLYPPPLGGGGVG